MPRNLTALGGLLLVVIMLVGHARAPAQEEHGGVVSGRIIDSETAEPLDNVNVFLSLTTIGTSTDKSGTFRIHDVPTGIYDLVVSRLGYERQSITVKLIRADSLHYDIKLERRVLRMPEIQVLTGQPVEWKENLKLFTREFLGQTENAQKCRILNPEVLTLKRDEKENNLSASADSILIVENNAFGYRIYLILIKFEWNLTQGNGKYFVFSKFEELNPRNGREFLEWTENRRKSYQGSLKHFLWAVNADRAEDEQFYIYAGKLRMIAQYQRQEGHYPVIREPSYNYDLVGGHRVNSQELLGGSEEGSPFKMIRFLDDLRVEYWGRTPHDVSFLTLTGSYVMIDSLGNLLNPLSVEVSGGWSQKRVAELLPIH